ncbi:hypothetical protein NW762_005369 [Fusarium torreyae]|uniref:NmrA-like domain-containing protein n=1 Tax=Fusarium torreyae TaxID=1237075 RepID=A0A9W8S2N5_9HYPO|nr:hypothetical protein NW762_005369 [Fusarium torreyae]
MPRSILVIGSTGNQGGAVIDNLLELEADFTILAVTRNTASPSAQKQKLLQKSSKIKVVQGDLDHPASLFKNTKAWEPNPLASNYTPKQELL